MAIFIFDSTHQALAAERILEENGFDIDVVAPPPAAKADCGLAIEASENDANAAADLLRRQSVVFEIVLS